jgi:hypothetical protein
MKATSNQPSALFRAIRDFQGKRSDYITETVKVIFALSDIGIAITGAVTDNFRVQVSDFDYRAKRPLQSFSENKKIRKFRRFPVSAIP